jgi:hypothetical protein
VALPWFFVIKKKKEKKMKKKKKERVCVLRNYIIYVHIEHGAFKFLYNPLGISHPIIYLVLWFPSRCWCFH